MPLEIDATYILERGNLRAVFNDSEDPDFVGHLDPDDGLTGLDGAEVRESSDNLVENDGGVNGDFWRGRRPVTIKGWVYPDPLIESNRKQDLLVEITDALREDMTLRWTNTGGTERQLTLRTPQPIRITDRRPKRFLISAVAADPRIYSNAEQSQLVLATGAASLGGFLWPLVFPLDFGGSPSVGAAAIVNDGNADSPPWFRLDGPLVNPIVANDTVGLELRFNYTLPEGSHLIIDGRDPADRKILLNGESPLYSALDFEASTWWHLAPRSNDVRLRASSYASPAALTVYWRHASHS